MKLRVAASYSHSLNTSLIHTGSMTAIARAAIHLWPVRGRSYCTVAVAFGTSFDRVVNRCERISNLVDQLRFTTEQPRAHTTAPRPNRLLQVSIATISVPNFSGSCATDRGAVRRPFYLAVATGRLLLLLRPIAAAPAGSRPARRLPWRRVR
jgi:hypothetical protein